MLSMLLAANKTKNSMNIEEAREYCLSLKNVTECFPFDDVSLVFKVEGKMFCSCLWMPWNRVCH